MAKKPRPPLKGSHKATVLAAEALRQLLKTKAQQAVLAKRVSLLKQIISREGGGTAHGHRAYTTFVRGGTFDRVVRVKPHEKLNIITVKK